jgi:pantoate--beta-alanine ligase
VSAVTRSGDQTVAVTRTIVAAREAIAALPRPLGLVPTMGALHEGHLTLIRAAADECAAVVMTIFVNPTQFGPREDFASYPRDERRDVELAAAAGVDLVFAPPVAEMYPPDAVTSVHLDGPLTTLYEAAERPGHFDGVATVVAKLLSIVGPQRAYFGRKDAQQLAVVRRLTADLDLPVKIRGVETVREPDGLALSSRNVYLTAAQRAKAPELHRALQAGRARAADGAKAIVDEVTAKLVLGFPPYLRLADDPDDPRPAFSVDYVAVVDPTTFAPAGERRPGEATFGAAPGADTASARTCGAVAPDSLIIAAARLGATRLLDNVAVGSATGDSATGDSGAGDSGNTGLKNNSNAAGNAATTREQTTPHEPDPRGGPASAKED